MKKQLLLRVSSDQVDGLDTIPPMILVDKTGMSENDKAICLNERKKLGPGSITACIHDTYPLGESSYLLLYDCMDCVHGAHAQECDAEVSPLLAARSWHSHCIDAVCAALTFEPSSGAEFIMWDITV